MGFRENAFETPYLKFTMTNIYESSIRLSSEIEVIYCVKFPWNPFISFWLNLLNIIVTFLKYLSVYSFVSNTLVEVFDR